MKLIAPVKVLKPVRLIVTTLIRHVKTWIVVQLPRSNTSRGGWGNPSLSSRFINTDKGD